MKFINTLFIISLMITCSLQENMLEQTEEQTEELLNTEVQSMAELQLGSSEEMEMESENTMTEEFLQNYYNGNWLMYGYGCNRNTPKVEKGHCVTEGSLVICTKTLGDDCVTTGTETFRGTIPEVLKTGINIPITYVVGNAGRPNSGHWKNSMHIVDLNEFRSQNRIYVRDPKITSLAPKPAPVPVPVPTPAPVPVPVPTPKPVVVIPAQRLVYYYSNYFLGDWNVIGNVCDEHTPQIEVVNITYAKGRLYATKLIGDNCVPAKKLSFEAAIPETIWQGETFLTMLNVSATKKIKKKITVVDLNTFQIGKQTYYRSMGKDSAHPHGVYINMTSIVGHSKYPGPQFVNLNPRKNMRSPVRRFVIVEEETNKPGNC